VTQIKTGKMRTMLLLLVDPTETFTNMDVVSSLSKASNLRMT
jgi:hypothetical protein